MNSLIYALCDPSTLEVRYVGLSTTGIGRPKSHFCPSSLKKKSPKSSWIKAVKAKGLLPIIRILGQWEVITFDELCEAERYWISYFRVNGSPLTNMTDGGEGATGHTPGPETRAKMSAARRGCKQSEEHRRNRSNALMGRKGSKAWTGRKHTPETIAKMTGRKFSDEHRHNISQAAKARCLAAKQASKDPNPIT